MNHVVRKPQLVICYRVLQKSELHDSFLQRRRTDAWPFISTAGPQIIPFPNFKFHMSPGISRIRKIFGQQFIYLSNSHGIIYEYFIFIVRQKNHVFISMRNFFIGVYLKRGRGHGMTPVPFFFIFFFTYIYILRFKNV